MKIHLSAPFVVAAVCASLSASPATISAQQAASSTAQTATGTTGTVSPEVIPHRNARRNLISTQEIMEIKARDAYELVSLMRPLWLNNRGFGTGRIVVYRDGVPFGNPESLRQIDANSVGSIRFLNGVQATAELGTGHGDGVILVKTRG